MKNLITLSTLAAALLGWAGIAQAQDTVLDNFVAVSTALSQDDLSAAKTAATQLAAAAKAANESALATHASQLAASDSLVSAREHFKAASPEAIKLATGKAGYYVFTCPMAKADWVQSTKDVQNPYMGKAMPGCGSIKGATSMGAMKMGGCCG